ncbi:MAG TPA: NAD+ synthase [Mycobacteriales bacterium]|jgi:NAD+ synthase (glutamine-hydrolysing)|nr:NAD+ synthase [Mycobacteriales bacterium]
MPRLRVALAQIDLTVGDLSGNADRIVEQTHEAVRRGAALVAFPEMALTGYPPEDLVLRRSFVTASRAALEQLASRIADEGCGDVGVVVGYLDRCADAAPRVGRPAGEPQNAAAFLHGGSVIARYAKHHLPNYGVFDEFRYFVPGDRLPVVRLGEVDVAITICEDLWQEGGPIAAARAAGAGLVLCINGSPYERNKDDVRLELATRRAAEAGATLAYVNLVGGQDELVFDGDSLIVGADGDLLSRAARFVPELLVADLDLPAATEDSTGAVDAGDGTSIVIERCAAAAAAEPPDAVAPSLVDPMAEDAEVWAALVLGTRDYVRKNGFHTVVLGLSGGIDSAIVATIARDALGADAVHVVGLPSRHSSPGSLTDAEELARRQGLRWSVLPIEPMVEAYDQSFAATETGGLHGLAAENLQARIRGTALMALSNEVGHLVLTTGNKSELATGFSTLYGDSAGGFAPIKDVPKTLVWQLARWRNAVAREAGEPEPIPVEIIDKAPSAELAPGQLDADRLPDYDILDAILVGYVEHDLGRDELLALGHPAELVDRVVRLVDAAEYKRRQYPPGPKITPKGFGRDRRLPITNRWREPAP